MATETFDAVVVGASLAGCTAAVLLGRQGVKVALVERHAEPESHKALCTHYIQASALPVLERLGLDRRIEAAGGVRNPIEVYTPSGWVGFHLEGEAGSVPDHGYNIRRVRLDPMLRELAAGTPGVEMRVGSSASGLIRSGGRISGVELGGPAGGRTLRARLVVAADGRNSPLATMAGATTKSAPNCRFGVMAALRNVTLRRGATSQMWLIDGEAAYAFPNDDGVTVIACGGLKDSLERARERPFAALVERIEALPDAPGLERAELAGPVLMVRDFPSQWRAPVVDGMAFVGDALQSIDWVWGIGCGWAFQTGAWLSDSVATDLRSGADLSAGLRRYRRRCASLTGHRLLINDFARRRALNPVERLMFAAAAKDVGMARHLNRFGARIDGPSRFLAPTAIMRAAWVNLRHPVASPEGTRAALNRSSMMQ
jgi:flavin-dependent dehydrogenase